MIRKIDIKTGSKTSIHKNDANSDRLERNTNDIGISNIFSYIQDNGIITCSIQFTNINQTFHLLNAEKKSRYRI